MNTILDRIVVQTRSDLHKRKQEVSWKDLESRPLYERPRRGFRSALKNETPLSVIAEIKKASPSKGVIREIFDPLDIARCYVRGGAAALSVLTDKPFFQGSLSYLETVSENVSIPVLRKDFIVDPYQIREARASGADAVLLIVSVTSGDHLTELLHAAREEGLDALVECYSEEEVDRLEWDEVDLVGVNNRDLRTFRVDLHRGVELLNRAPSHVVRVSESGLSSSEDLHYLVRNGVQAALMGEHLMRQPEPEVALADLLTGVEGLMEENR